MLDNIATPADAAVQAANAVTTRIKRAIQRTGAQVDDVERLPFDLSALDEEGIFVNVDAHGFGILDRRLDWHALGISLPRSADLAFRPPRCGLLPDRYRLALLRPASRAHAALRKYSYRFRQTETLFETPAYRWVPWRAFEAFEHDFQSAHAALEAAKGEVTEHYDMVREEIVETFLQLATDSARRLQATGHVIPEGFHDAIIQGVIRTIPSPEDLRDRLELRYRVGIVVLGSEMLAEQRKAQEARRNLEEIEAARRLDRQREEVRARQIQQELWADEERIRRQLQAEEDERQREAAVKERLRQLKLEAARERLEEAMSPIEEGAQQLHAAIYEAATAIHTSLQKHHYLPGASARRARELARWFRLMNWQSDQQLEALLAELEQLARRTSGKQKRDTASISGVLEDIIALCYDDARALVEPHRMTALEL